MFLYEWNMIKKKSQKLINCVFDRGTVVYNSVFLPQCSVSQTSLWDEGVRCCCVQHPLNRSKQERQLGRRDAGQSCSRRIRDRLHPRRSTLTLSSKYCMNYMCWVSCTELTTADKDRCSSSCRDLLNLALKEAAGRLLHGLVGESAEAKTPQQRVCLVIWGEAVKQGVWHLVLDCSVISW